MTVAIGFRCRDGIVLGADSMLTQSIGHLNVGHHLGIKVQTLTGNQVLAFAGDVGQAGRFRSMCESSADLIHEATDPLQYPLTLSGAIIKQFNETGIRDAIDVSTLLSFVFKGECQLCAFEGSLQPRLLDEHHYYVALGSGKLSADPFLRFLADIFCADGPPSVSEAIWLTTWIIEHVCAVTPGGVAPPVRICVIEREEGGDWGSRTLDTDELGEHHQSIEDAKAALREWRSLLAPKRTGETPSSAPPIPKITD